MDYPREPEPPAAGPVFAENSGKIRYDFSYGSVNTRYFPFREWKRCFDDALLRLENDDYLRYPLRPGCEELRKTLASYFNQSRGLRCVKEQIVITSCLQQNMEIISGMFPKETHTLAFEEPGHINKMRTIFRKHYQAMLKALDTVFGDRIRVIEHGAGLHMLIQVKETSLSERELMKKAAAAGVQIYNVADYWIDQEKRPRNLFMLGFGSLTEEDIEKGIRLLKEAWFGPEPGEDL